MLKFKNIRRALNASKYSVIVLAVLFAGLIGSGLVAANSLNLAGATLGNVSVGVGTPAQSGNLSCSGPGTAAPNAPVTFTASGGNGTYSWSSIQGNGSGPTYTKSFPNLGTKVVTVTSGGDTATCSVQITNTTTPPPPATGGNCTIKVNSNAFTNWIIGGPQPDGEFIHSPDYPHLTKSGTHTEDSSGNDLPRGNYNIIVPQEVDGWKNPTVTPSNKQFCEPGSAGQTITFNVKYATPPPATHCLDLQASQISSSNSTRTAQVTITNPNASGSDCAKPAGFASYRTFVQWTGDNFNDFVGTQKLFDKTSTTIAPGQSRTMTVSLPACNWQVDAFKDGTQPKEPPFYGEELMRFKLEHGLGVCGDTQPQLACTANPSSAQINDQISFTATGGTGTFSWTTSGGNPNSGNGSVFITRYGSVGTKTATVTSGNQTATCPVTIFQPPVQQQPPVCNPGSQTVNINQNANFTASGGNGSFSWTVAGGGTPGFGSGSNFSTRFATPGTKTVTVTSNGRTDQCIVIVQQVSVPPLVCSPASQNVNVNQNASFTVTGGNGGYTWSGGGTPPTGSGSNFTTKYGTSGNKTVTVRDAGGRTANCNVNVNQVSVPPPVCNPSSQNAEVGESVNFNASGGNGSFSWSAGSGSPSSGNGSSFSTSFDNDGTHVVNVTSNGQTDSCIVHVDDEEDENLFCSPSFQEIEEGERADFTVTGGNGNYTWDADEGDASPDSGSGDDFSARFDDEGTHTVRVRDSAGRSDTCQVRVEEEDFEEDDLECTPSSQTVRVGEEVDFRARGGTGDFEWDAEDGSPRFGFGSRFSTSFDSPGRYEVELESNGEEDTCRVTVEDEPDFEGSLFCSPSVQSANVNDFVTFTVTGGDGSFFWSATGNGSPSTGNGSSFGTRFLTPGTKFVTVSSDGRISQCTVQIGTVLGASSIITGPTETAAAAAGLGFLGALGAYGAVFRKSSKKFLTKVVSRLR